MAALLPTDLLDFLARAFPHLDVAPYRITSVTDDALVFSFTTKPEHLRPGDTVSGPTLMSLADTAAYLLLVARAGGPGPTDAPNAAARSVTSALQMSFLRRPRAGTLVVRATLLKAGRTLSVVDVHVSGEEDALYAQATVTYATPDT
jgi:uncharacterized protein (TIGR00369 family)